MTEEYNLETLRSKMNSESYFYREQIENYLDEWKEILQQIFKHEIKLAEEWRQVGYAEQLRRIKKKVLG